MARTKKRVTSKSAEIKDFTDEDDLQDSDEMAKSPSGNIIKIQNDEKVPLYFIKSEYTDGLAHWIPMPDGNNVRVPCCAPNEKRDVATEICPICKYVDSLFKKAKAQKNKNSSNATFKRAMQMRRNYEIYFIALKGNRSVVKIDPKTHKKKTQIEFESNKTAGLLRLSKTQYQALRALPVKYDFITTNKDLFNRYIIADKQIRGKDEFASIEFIPAAKPTRKPEDIIIPEDVTLDNQFDIDVNLAKKTLKLYLNSDVDDEEGLDFEDENDDEEEDTVAKRKTGSVSKRHSTGKRSARNRSNDDDVLDSDFEEADDDEIDDEEDLEDQDDFEDESDDEEDFDDEEEINEEDEEDDYEEEGVDEDDEEEDFDDDFLDDVDDDFEDDDFEDNEEEEEPIRPKKRGGRKVSKVKKTEKVEAPVKGKRGRPLVKKTEVEKPSKKSVKTSTKISTKTTASDTPKRGRGRPPKATTEKVSSKKTTAKKSAKSSTVQKPVKKTSARRTRKSEAEDF